jgi:MurNAc alpha-1-phosphate uridylyltransferase
MKAMVLAAGYGSRLGAITKSIPKCLVEAGGKTLLAHTIERLRDAGVTHLVINLYHLGHLIEEYVKANNFFGLNIIFSQESTLLGTGGGLQAAKEFFSDNQPFFLHNSDIVSDINLSELYRIHCATPNVIATLAVNRRDTSRPLLFSPSGRLVGWEKSEEERGEVLGSEVEFEKLGFTGIQVLSPKIFSYLNGAPPFSTISAFMKAVHAGEYIQAFRVDNIFWIDAGTPDTLHELRSLLSSPESLN